jgi:hypothetical protein
MTWNSEGILCSGRELALLNLLTTNNVNIGIVTEAEIPASGLGDFNVEGYHSYLPHASKLLKTAKYQVVVLVRSALATSTKFRLDLMHAAVQLIWIQLDLQGTPRTSRYSWTSGYARLGLRPLQGVVGPRPGDDRPVQGQGTAAGGGRGGGQSSMSSSQATSTSTRPGGAT